MRSVRPFQNTNVFKSVLETCKQDTASDVTFPVSVDSGNADAFFDGIHCLDLGFTSSTEPLFKINMVFSEVPRSIVAAACGGVASYE